MRKYALERAAKNKLIKAEVHNHGPESKEEETEAKLTFICGKAHAYAENLALQSGLPIKLVTERLRQLFQRA